MERRGHIGRKVELYSVSAKSIFPLNVGKKCTKSGPQLKQAAIQNCTCKQSLGAENVFSHERKAVADG